MTERKLSKLPKWAAEWVSELIHIIKRLKRANSMLSKQYPESDTFAMLDLNNNLYLEPYTRVCFKGRGVLVTVHTSPDGHVRVEFDSGIIIPQARNTIHIVDQNNKGNK